MVKTTLVLKEDLDKLKLIAYLELYARRYQQIYSKSSRRYVFTDKGIKQKIIFVNKSFKIIFICYSLS